jgi:predicted amidohydrolase
VLLFLPSRLTSFTAQIAQTSFVLLFFFTRIICGTGARVPEHAPTHPRLHAPAALRPTEPFVLDAGVLASYNLVHIPEYVARQGALRQAHIMVQLAAWFFSRLLNFFWSALPS